MCVVVYRSESIRTGFMLSQGGEFAFVLLSLASSLHVLPDNLNQVLIIVVVMSMALTPGLAQVRMRQPSTYCANILENQSVCVCTCSSKGSINAILRSRSRTAQLL